MRAHFFTSGEQCKRYYTMATDNLDINKLKVPELKLFLRDRGLPVSGSKHELIERARGAIELGKRPRHELKKLDDNFQRDRNLDRLVSPLGEKLPALSELKSGWIDDISSIPCVTNNDLYNYLVLNNKRTFDSKPVGAKRQLKAKVFYSDRHLHSVKFHEIDTELSHCYVKALVIPSIPTQKENKKDYIVWACLSKITGQVHAAGCDCAAGDGEACNHVAALLYALVDITDKKRDGLNASTSKECLWNKPRARKLSPKKAKDLVFKKQKFSETVCEIPPKKPEMSNLKSTPKPINLERFANQLQKCNPHAAFLLAHTETLGKFKRPLHRDLPQTQLGLPEPDFMYRDNIDLSTSQPKLAFSSYLTKLCISEELCQTVESRTRKQYKCKEWNVARRDRITSSTFGIICKKLPTTSPESMLKSVMGYSNFTCDSVEWGNSHESAARRFYVKHALVNHPGISVKESGFIINKEFPHLGSSPDGLVHCPHCTDPNGILEIKCPFKYRNMSPLSAAKSKDFFCTEKNGQLLLKKRHHYYYQVQGQLAISQRNWCDFYVWTLEGSSVERIEYDAEFWGNMVSKLNDFFLHAVVPEIFTRRVERGKMLKLPNVTNFKLDTLVSLDKC